MAGNLTVTPELFLSFINSNNNNMAVNKAQNNLMEKPKEKLLPLFKEKSRKIFVTYQQHG